MTDIIVIGHGPAGASASVYAARAGKKVMMIGKDQGALAKATQVDNFYGHATPVTGASLVSAGLSQAKRLGVEVVTGEVVGLSLDTCFSVKTAAGEDYEAQAVILATGASRTAPSLEGWSRFENAGISYCAVCDAFFYRGKDVAVLGRGAYALHELSDLLPLVRSVTLLTDGKPAEVTFPSAVPIITAPLASLSGEAKLSAAHFEDGTTLEIAGLFVALGVAGSTALAKKIGAVTEKNNITVDSTMQTSVPGLWAAGDCTGGMKQVAKAVYEGAVAGSEAAKFITRL